MPELNWLGDRKARRAARHVAHRLLQPVEQVGDDANGNLLIQGDNLEALKALLPLYAGRVKCIFIDPPYNTRSAFEHYDDNLEHSQWLSMMVPRLALLRDLLSEDGSIWVTIDDNEAHYLKVLMDEVFGRRNFVANVVWQKTLTRRNDARALSNAHDHVLAYAKSFDQFAVNKLEAGEKQRATYTNRDNDPRGDWLAVPFHAPNIRPNLTYEILTPGGRSLWPPKGRCWSTTKEKFDELVADNRVYFGLDGNGMAQRKKFWNESENKMVPWTWWGYQEAGDNREANREAKEIAEAAGIDLKFDTPKPEKLLKMVLEIATTPNDIVLDSFLGSGTTAAVAHKMGRRWIGIEMGEHARTHCLPRLKKVVTGEQGGISQAVGWQGGGGFSFVQLGEEVFDEYGRIAETVRFAPLASWLWFAHTRAPHPDGRFDSPLLGVHDGTAFVLLYNGILGDKRPQGGNVLTRAVWQDVAQLLPGHDGPWVIFGEACRLAADTCKRAGIDFRYIPHELGIR
ncbi:DNA methylase [Lysobacter arseniciresistens ZS79]|uniref:site-specific DNA-methyltransferase (adenine-specific) n=1 Tax=Lysobacter arseniciresistens ZS79 TaxID=913325 RepID=A0A0A0F2Q8_9GAMM|nr:site-specific DNA-methyltransferase [Lysobacter arseniciresistens]KGM57401.1 DNA methylase [Lysobacter arseniciresistens ZS79]